MTAIADTAAGPIVRWHYLGYSALALLVMTAAIASHERWFLNFVHVISGVLWIGLLYYFNFVQMPSMPKIPDEQKPAIGKVIAPTALFWFRWAAATTVLFGLLTAGANGSIGEALSFQELDALLLELRPNPLVFGDLEAQLVVRAAQLRSALGDALLELPLLVAQHLLGAAPERKNRRLVWL